VVGNRGEFALGELHSTPHFHGRSVNWRKIAISLIDSDSQFSTSEIAWFRQLTAAAPLVITLRP
jgi:hypothetical protein